MARPNSRYFAAVINKIKASKKRENIMVDHAFKAELKENLMRRIEGGLAREEGGIVFGQSGIAAFFNKWRYQLMAVPAALMLLIVAVQAFRLVVPVGDGEILAEEPLTVGQEIEEVAVTDAPKIVTFPGRFVLPEQKDIAFAIEPIVSAALVDVPAMEVSFKEAEGGEVESAVKEDDSIKEKKEAEYADVPASETGVAYKAVYNTVPSAVPVSLAPVPASLAPLPRNVNYLNYDYYSGAGVPYAGGDMSVPLYAQSYTQHSAQSAFSQFSSQSGLAQSVPAQPTTGDFVAIASSKSGVTGTIQSGATYPSTTQYAIIPPTSGTSYAVTDYKDKIKIDEVLREQYLVFFDASWLNTIQKKVFVKEVVEIFAVRLDEIDYVYIYTYGANTLRVVVVYEDGGEKAGTFRLNSITNHWDNMDCCSYDLR